MLVIRRSLRYVLLMPAIALLAVAAWSATAGPTSLTATAPVAQAAGCTPETGGSPPGGTSNDSMAQQALQLINQQRAQQTAIDGIPRPPLTINSQLQAAALWKATNLAVDNYWGDPKFSGSPHDDYTKSGTPQSYTFTFLESWYQHIINCGYSGYNEIGENIAAGYSSAQAVVNGWMNSCGHKTNIMDGNFTQAGIEVVSITSDVVGASSIYGSYWANEFGTKSGYDPAKRIDFCTNPNPTPSPTPTVTQTPTTTSTPSPTPSPTTTSTPSPTPTASSTPSATPTVTQTPTTTTTPSPTPSPTGTQTPTATPPPTRTPSPRRLQIPSGFGSFVWQGPAAHGLEAVLNAIINAGAGDHWTALFEPVPGTFPLQWRWVFPNSAASATLTDLVPGRVYLLFTVTGIVINTSGQ